MNIAIYSREHPGVPSKSIDELFKMKEWADKEGHTVIQTFVETASSIVEGRLPARREMIELALSREHPFDGILVHAYSCISLDLIETVIFSRAFHRANVRVIAFTQMLSVDEQKSLEKLLLRLVDEFRLARMATKSRQSPK